MNGNRLKTPIRIIIITVLAVLLILAAAFGFYVRDYYHADPAALEVLTRQDPQVAVTETPGKQIVFQPLSPEHIENTESQATEESRPTPQPPATGIIFYPGGKVQYEAYAPLMKALSERGILCVIVHMPCNLAVLDVNAAGGIPEQHPEVEHWYLCGHSLGGVMAASYAAKHSDTFEGLILLASYTTKPIARGSLRVLSIYGSADGVLNRESYQKNITNLPKGTKEIVIEGGCHAYFGNYGNQKGDGTPAITREEQIRQTADAVAAFLNETK